jgi:hypothetical protein
MKAKECLHQAYRLDKRIQSNIEERNGAAADFGEEVS